MKMLSEVKFSFDWDETVGVCLFHGFSKTP